MAYLPKGSVGASALRAGSRRVDAMAGVAVTTQAEQPDQADQAEPAPLAVVFTSLAARGRRIAHAAGHAAGAAGGRSSGGCGAAAAAGVRSGRRLSEARHRERSREGDGAGGASREHGSSFAGGGLASTRSPA